MPTTSTPSASPQQQQQLQQPHQAAALKDYIQQTELFTTLQLLLAAVLSSVLLVLFVTSWQVVASLAFLALFFGSWQYINVLVLARFACYLKLAQVTGDTRTIVGSISTSVANAFTDSNNNDDDTSNNPLSVKTDPKAAELVHVHSNSSSTSTSTTTTSNIDTTNSTSNNSAEPPYSIAIVAVVGANFIVQIVLQAVLFTGLQLQLYAACWVLVLVFVGVTIVFCCYSVARFGRQRLWLACSSSRSGGGSASTDYENES